SSVVRFRATPVALFLIETMTPGITAPLASVTVPESVAPVTCACTDTPGKRLMAKTKKTERAMRSRSEATLRCIEPPTFKDDAAHSAGPCRKARQREQAPKFTCDQGDFGADYTRLSSSRH